MAKTIVCCTFGVPLPPYIKEGRRRPANKVRARERGVLATRTLVLVGFGPLFSFFWGGKRGKGEEEERERVARPLP